MGDFYVFFTKNIKKGILRDFGAIG